MMVALPLHADTIGDITELTGYGKVFRDEPYEAAIDFDINSLDNVQTRAGRIAITFLDESTVKLTEHSELLIDSYIYDPAPTVIGIAPNVTPIPGTQPPKGDGTL